MKKLKTPYLAYDLETVGLKPHNGTVWMVATNHNGKIDVQYDCNGVEQITGETVLALANEDVVKIIHSSEFDGPYTELNLIIKKAGKRREIVEFLKMSNIWDTRIAELLILGYNIPRGEKNEELAKQGSSSLKYTLMRYGLGKLNKGIRANFIDRPKGKPFTKAEIDYAKGDVKDLPKLMVMQKERLEELELMPLAELEMIVCEAVIDMRVRGIGFDKKVWDASVKADEIKAKELLKKLKSRAMFLSLSSSLHSIPENWNSPKQVKEFFEAVGIVIPSLSDIEVIERDLKIQDEVDPKALECLKLFMEYRTLSQAIAKYGYDYPVEHVNADGRIRCNVEQVLNTGRFALSNPNLSQLPGHGTRRGAFVAKPGHVFVIGDFSGQEIGIMAAASNERVWINAILQGHDIHGWAASVAFPDAWHRGAKKNCKFPFKCECPEHQTLRQSGKILNFMLAYGGGPTKYAYSTGCTMREARLTIGNYKRGIRHLTYWLDQNAKQAATTGLSFSASPYRRRRVLLAEERWKMENQGKNNPIQAAGADMLKHAIMLLHAQGAPMVLTIHDEIILEVKKGEAKKAVKILKKCMEEAADFITGIPKLVTVEPRIAPNLQKK